MKMLSHDRGVQRIWLQNICQVRSSPQYGEDHSLPILIVMQLHRSSPAIYERRKIHNAGSDRSKVVREALRASDT